MVKKTICVKCEVSPRVIGSYCKACQRERARIWSQANPEKGAEYSRKRNIR